MSESDTAPVECPLCEEEFDLAAAGGWCTNSDCGEWQYEMDVTPDQDATEPDDEDAAEPADADEDDAAAEVAVDDEAVDEGAEDAAEDDAITDDTEDGAADDGANTEDADAEEETVDAAETAEAADVDDVTDDAADADDDAAPADEATAEADQAETFDCPGCGSSLDAGVNFCPDCGEDVSGLPAEESGDELDACPSCGADVDAGDGFCVECGEDLNAHRGSPDELAECPDCGTDVDADDSFCAGCGADLDAHRAGDVAAGSDEESDSADDSPAPAPETLALTAHGQSVVVDDGDAVGREIRSLLTDAGRPEDEAVRVHREHARFVRESGRFYVVDLGANPTRLNGVSMEKGDREQVSPGDELALSDVVTLTVEAP